MTGQLEKKRIVRILAVVFLLTIFAAPMTYAGERNSIKPVLAQTNNKAIKTVSSSKNKKAHKAYSKQIKKDKNEYCPSRNLLYVYKDFDGDGIDELVTYPGFGYCMEILYTYKSGKVVELLAIGQKEFHKYYEKQKILYVIGGHMDQYYQEYYKFKGNKLIKKAYREEIVTWKNEKFVSQFNYYTNGKKVKKSEYQAYVKKLIKGEKAKPFSKLKWKNY